MYTHDQMEDVFALVNTWLDSPSKPVRLVHYGLFAYNAEFDHVNVGPVPS